jgi:hypothetical protein
MDPIVACTLLNEKFNNKLKKKWIETGLVIKLAIYIILQLLLVIWYDHFYFFNV